MTQEHHSHRDEGETTMDLATRIPHNAASKPEHPAGSPAGRAAVRPQDLRAQTEKHVRSRGRWLIIGGLSFAGLILVMSIVWHQGFGRPMPSSYTLPLYALGFGALAIGAMEFLTRPTRDGFERLEVAVETLNRDLDRLVGLLPEALHAEYYQIYADALRDTHRQTGTENARSLQRSVGKVTPFPRASKRNGR